MTHLARSRGDEGVTAPLCASATILSTFASFEISLKEPSEKPTANISFAPLLCGNHSISVGKSSNSMNLVYVLFLVSHLNIVLSSAMLRVGLRLHHGVIVVYLKTSLDNVHAIDEHSSVCFNASFVLRMNLMFHFSQRYSKIFEVFKFLRWKLYNSLCTSPQSTRSRCTSPTEHLNSLATTWTWVFYVQATTSFPLLIASPCFSTGFHHYSLVLYGISLYKYLRSKAYL